MDKQSRRRIKIDARLPASNLLGFLKIKHESSDDDITYYNWAVPANQNAASIRSVYKHENIGCFFPLLCIIIVGYQIKTSTFKWMDISF